MSVIAVVTNLLLPYWFDLFSLQEVGALSTLALLSALAYAISMHQLFDVRVIIKRTFVYTLLLGTVFAIYSSFVFLFTQVVQNGAALSGANFFASMIAAVVIGTDAGTAPQMARNQDRRLFVQARIPAPASHEGSDAEATGRGRAGRSPENADGKRW